MRRAIKKLKPLLLQCVGISLLSLAVVLGAILCGQGFVLTAGYWGVLPLAGFASSLWVARAGISCYLAWILPPVCMSAVPWLIVGYPPYAGSMFLCLFLSMVGAATGEVLRKRREEGTGGKE